MISRIVSAGVSLILCASLVRAAKPSELDRAAGAMAGSTAAFTQRFTPKGFRNSQAESGSVTFGTLPMMRWEYVRPEVKLFIFDGTRSWFYTPADKQVTVSQLDEQRRRELPFLFIGSSSERDRFFVVSEKVAAGQTRVTLQPRTAGMVRTVLITIRTATHLIERVEYADREGNQTSFELTGYRTSGATPQTFRFTPPAGVQVIEQ